MVYLLMGVSGVGKTTIGLLLSEELKLKFYDADDFHTKESVLKMKRGIPLDDNDRKVWLDTISKHIKSCNNSEDTVLACSALKQKYREIITSYGKERVVFIYLKGSKKIIEYNLLNRKNHFFPIALLNSQYEILEKPKYSITLTIDNKTPKEICYKVIKKINNMDDKHEKE